ncbi:MAG TPA: hypothetical protein VJ323_09100, partial [Bryobacteraceae bacterium]|nr:hypothetical protein [Bryobacteraceae bacterium]
IDPLRINVDADASGAVLLGGGNHDAAITTAKIVNNIAFPGSGEFQHRVHDIRRTGYVRRSDLDLLWSRNRNGGVKE